MAWACSNSVRRTTASDSAADVLWESQNWPGAAEAFEGLVETAAGSEAMGEQERRDVLRAAIAFSFADDGEGLARLRAAFAGRLARTPDAEAFETLTAPIETQGVEFRDMACRIASVDTLSAFMQRMRTGLDAQADAAQVN